MVHFDDYPNFTPNLTPQQIFTLGSFGGTYWRPIYSRITKQKYKDQHKEFKWLKKIDKKLLTSVICESKRNNYNVSVGTSLKFWEDKGWMNKHDPYGWVQWYCRFYDGRRSDDDTRQIKRWEQFAGPKGRFRRWLITLIINKNTTCNDHYISPKIRQSLQHWGYRLNKKDFEKDKKRRQKKTITKDKKTDKKKVRKSKDKKKSKKKFKQ